MIPEWVFQYFLREDEQLRLFSLGNKNPLWLPYAVKYDRFKRLVFSGLPLRQALQEWIASTSGALLSDPPSLDCINVPQLQFLNLLNQHETNQPTFI